MLLLEESVSVLLRIPFLTKELHKAIKRRSRLRNKFLKTKSITDMRYYNVQWNYCKKLLISTKKSNFNNLEISKINDIRSFWKTVVLLFSKKTSKSEKINLNEEGKNVSENAELYGIFNNFFFRNHFQFENAKYDK